MLLGTCRMFNVFVVRFAKFQRHILHQMSANNIQAPSAPLPAMNSTPPPEATPPPPATTTSEVTAATLQQTLPSSIRATEEYAAAFDLEVWKAEQRKAFEERLVAELHQHRKALEVEYAARDVERLEEADALRRELEAMAKRLQSTGKVLTKRIANLEKREEAFEARRLQTAEESERKLREDDMRHRRAMDEAHLKAESLASQLKERDIVAQQAQQRFLVLQQEYDTLQRVTSRLQSRESSEAGTIAELRTRCDSLSGTVRDLQKRAEDAQDKLKTAQDEREQLIAACRTYRDQTQLITNEYNTLAGALQQERERAVALESQRLAETARQQEMHDWNATMYNTMSSGGGGRNPIVGGGGGRGAAVSHADLLSAAFVASSRGGGGGHHHQRGVGMNGAAGGDSGDIAALRQLVEGLKLEASKEEQQLTRRRRAEAERRKERKERNAVATRGTAVGAAIRYAEVGDAERLSHPHHGRYPDDSMRSPHVSPEHHHLQHLDDDSAHPLQRSVSPLRPAGTVANYLFHDAPQDVEGEQDIIEGREGGKHHRNQRGDGNHKAMRGPQQEHTQQWNDHQHRLHSGGGGGRGGGGGGGVMASDDAVSVSTLSSTTGAGRHHSQQQDYAFRRRPLSFLDTDEVEHHDRDDEDGEIERGLRDRAQLLASHDVSIATESSTSHFPYVSAPPLPYQGNDTYAAATASTSTTTVVTTRTTPSSTSFFRSDIKGRRVAGATREESGRGGGASLGMSPPSITSTTTTSRSLTTSTSVVAVAAGATPSTTTTTDGLDVDGEAAFIPPVDMDSASSLTELRAFVERLRDNRNRLIETGVYAEGDPLLEGLARKIRMYEHYLSAHYE